MKSRILGFECLSCGEQADWGRIRYRCAKCGSNLNVVYDYAALKKKMSPRRWSERPADLLRYRELLPLEKEATLPLSVGGTPLFQSGPLSEKIGHKALYLKDETRNPSASFKDRASSVVLLRAREERAAVVAAASTGNAGSSLACLAAAGGQASVIFIPKTAPKPKVAQLQVFGARVLAVNGNYDAAFDLCAEVCEKSGWYNRNTGLNPFTREGKKTVSFEIFEQLGGRRPDWVLVPTGDGNIISGVWKGFRDLLSLGWIDRLPRLAAVQAEGSNAVARAWRTRQPEGPGKKWVYSVEKISATTRADSISVDLPRDAVGALRAVEESHG
ncbi:MAG TPA: pyridoxal-phosphate dependent enzyme, partial [Elusimicrobiota bacterium]|nr:pyridoxal-phosphate dependent enzyme [Elusimicrobiota bacterium]